MGSLTASTQALNAFISAFLDSDTEDLALLHKNGLRIDAAAQHLLPFHGDSELAKPCHGGIPEWIL
jgi:hypothetical protein